MTNVGTSRTDLFRLDARVALVTGGTRGLGKEIALAMAHTGATVVVSSRKAQACADVAREISELTGRPALGIPSHTGSWISMEELVEQIDGELGTVDVLVNAAGMSLPYADLTDVTEDMYDKTVDVNMKGHFRVTTLVGERMRVGRGGSIVFVSSTAAATPLPRALPYAAAKAGVEALTVGFAWAFGPTVRVNCLRPGPFLTDVAKAWDVEAAEAGARRSIIAQRLGRPEEIVDAALFLASDASSYTTGAVLSVTGGAERKGPR